MRRSGIVISSVILVAFFLFLKVHSVGAETVYECDFEDGWGFWHTDNGVWGVGTPTSGPNTSYGGSQCAGTVLDGNYPGYTDSRLISPSIDLPSISGDEEIRLHFFHWFSYSSYDEGFVQISVYIDSSSSWTDWSNIGNSIVNTSAWSRMGTNLTNYAGERVRIAFYHTAGRDTWGNPSESSGWYIDDVEIIHNLPGFTGNFETGWRDWYADRGIWQIGIPTSGPDSAHGGLQCAGTILDGNYHAYTDSRLIMPTVSIPDTIGHEEVHVCFWHWLSYSSYENAYVQVSVYVDSTGNWSGWTTLGDAITSSSTWSYVCRELTDYIGERVRIAFYHTAGRDTWGNPSESYGWYIDDVSFVGFTPTGIGNTGGVNVSVPKSFTLSQNYPNPFNPSTTIEFDIPGESHGSQPVNLAVYDIRGRLVKTLADSEFEPGKYRVHWDGQNNSGEKVSSGIYLYRLKTGDKTFTRKMTLSK